MVVVAAVAALADPCPLFLSPQTSHSDLRIDTS